MEQIYLLAEGSVENDTLRGLDWTNGLDKVFREVDESARNNDNYEDFMWQYFGSQQGFVRHYPGTPWNEDPDVSFFIYLEGLFT